MLQVKNPILYFLLLILEILLNCYSNISYKQGGFSKILLKKNFKFVTNRENNIITFKLSLVLLLTEDNLVTKKQRCKRDIFRAYGIGCVKIIIEMPVEIIVFYIQALIVKFGIFGLNHSILKGKICLAIFLALNKQF